MHAPERRPLADVLLCIREKLTLAGTQDRIEVDHALAQLKKLGYTKGS